MFSLVKISLIKKTDPTCLSQQFCLKAQFIQQLNSCMPHFPTLFSSFLASSQPLGSCQFFCLQLLFSNACCFSFTYTHTFLHFPFRVKVEWLQDFQFCSPSPPLQECTREFYFQFRNSTFGTLRKKTCCHLHVSFATDLFFPCPSSPGQGHLPNAATLLRQRCCVFIPRETVVVSPSHHDSCHYCTLAVLHIEGLSELILRLCDTNDVRSKKVYLSRGLDIAQ